MLKVKLVSIKKAGKEIYVSTKGFGTYHICANATFKHKPVALKYPTVLEF